MFVATSSPLKDKLTTRAFAQLFIFVFAVFIIYFAGINIQYFEDDFQFIFDGSTTVWGNFIQKNPSNGWYRPVEAAFFTLVQNNFDLNTAPIHIVTMLTHALFAYLIFIAVNRSGYPLIHSILASSFMVFSQANAMAILSNDTLSQVAATMFGCISLWPLIGRDRSMGGEQCPNMNTFRSASIVAFACSLLSKETGVSFFFIILTAIIYEHSKFNVRTVRIRRILLESIPYLAVLLLYLVVRSTTGASQPAFGSQRYELHIGLNIIENLALTLFAIAIPTSTVTVFEIFHSKDLIALGLIAASSLMFLSCVAFGLWHRKGDPTVILAGLFMIEAAFPMVLMNHVSELYTYNVMPFFSVLVGIGLGTIWEVVVKNYIRQLIVAIFLIMATFHISAIQNKALLMYDNGERAANLLRQIGAYIRYVPVNGELFLLNPPARQGEEYSVYLMKGFNVLRYGESRIKTIYGREDIQLKIIEQSDVQSVKRGQNIMILALEGNDIRFYKAKDESLGKLLPRSSEL